MTITIVSWNVNGINSIVKSNNISNPDQKNNDKDESFTLADYIKKRKIDILCINETKLSLKNSSKTREFFDEYDKRLEFKYFNTSKTRQGYSGTAIWSKKLPLNVKYDIGKKNHDLEGRVITAEYDDFIVIAVYVPNSGEGLKRIDYRTKGWDIDFAKYIETVKKNSEAIA